jgi:geranylgeranyl diphosphate synthase type I
LRQQSIRSGVEKTSFQLYVSQTKKLIETELRELVSSLSSLQLHPQIEYALLSKGKRLRPILAILSAESVGGNRTKILPLALAFECMHTATLVHDDMIDKDEVRRGVPALYKKWSENDAILTGDALIALSVELASDYGETVLKTVAQSALELCEGEHMDINFSLKTATEKAYFTRIKKKSASLFRAATYCGALAGGGKPSEAHSLSAFGENFGIAYQLKDDLLDLTKKEKFTLKDLELGSITLPLIHCYSTSSPSEREQMENDIQTCLNQNCTVSSKPAENILENIRRAGSLDYCENKMDEHLHQAVASISMLRDTEYKAYLVEMTRALKTWG